MNIFGVKLIALSSTLFSILILAPFFVLIIVGLAKWEFDPLTPVTVPDAPFFGTGGVFALGLAIGVWMYSGYESMSTLSGEIRNPQKVIPRALMLAVPFIIVMYVLPTVASLAGYGHWDAVADRGRRRLRLVRRDRQGSGGLGAGGGDAGVGAARQPRALPRLPGVGGPAALRDRRGRAVPRVDLQR